MIGLSVPATVGESPGDLEEVVIVRVAPYDGARAPALAPRGPSGTRACARRLPRRGNCMSRSQAGRRLGQAGGANVR